MDSQLPDDEKNLPDVPPEYLSSEPLPDPNATRRIDSPLPDVPPEYLSSEPPADPNATRRVEPLFPEIPPEYGVSGAAVHPAAEPLAAPDVPPEYLPDNPADLPAASEQRPAPTTDVPPEYLEQPAVTVRTDTLPPPISSAPQGETPAFNLPPTPPATAIPPAPAALPVALKDRSVALILEILPGLFGFLGIGWIYAGNVTVGVLALVGYLLFLGFELLVIVFTGGLAACCLLPLNLVAVAVSALLLNNYMKERPEQFHK